MTAHAHYVQCMQLVGDAQDLLQLEKPFSVYVSFRRYTRVSRDIVIKSPEFRQLLGATF